jgi:hypothetical protein
MGQNQKEKIQHIKDVLDRHKNEIQKYGVHGSGVGFMKKDGEDTDELAIILYVEKKNDMIPKEIDGIPIQIVAIPEGFKPRDLKANE